MVRNFLTYYSNTGKKETLSLDLFKMLGNRKKKVSNQEASVFLFGNDQKNRIRVLKSRMKSKIFDALTTEIVIENQKYDASMKISILLKKKLIQFQTVYHSRKGNMKLIIGLLDDIIDKAKEYELYPILIEGLNSKKQIIGFRKGLAEYEFYEKQEQYAIDAQKGLTEIVNYYYKILLMDRTGNANKRERLKYLNNTIKKGEKILKIAESKSIEHYLNIIKYACYDEQKKYEEAKQVMLNELSLLENSKAVYRKSRLGATYDYLCQTNIRLGNYEVAADYAIKGKGCFKQGELNYAVAQEVEFRSLLYDKNLPAAKKIINNMRKQYKDSVDAHRIATHNFFLANWHFANKDFKKSKRISAKTFDFKADKAGWEFNSQILSIMASIEQDKMGIAYTSFDKLYRYFIKIRANNKLLSSRNKIILKIIGQWLGYGGNKSIAKMKNSPLIAKLMAPKNEWDPLGSELIPFHQWIKTKF